MSWPGPTREEKGFPSPPGPYDRKDFRYLLQINRIRLAPNNRRKDLLFEPFRNYFFADIEFHIVYFVQELFKPSRKAKQKFFHLCVLDGEWQLFP